MLEDREPLRDDDDLVRRAAQDDFLIKRIVKFGALACVLLLMAAIAVTFCRELVIDGAFRADILDVIKANIASIVIAGFGILEISIKK
jgi:hypothetical protein